MKNHNSEMKVKEEFLNLDFEQYIHNIGQLETIEIGEMEISEFEHKFESPFLGAFDTLNFIVEKPENELSKKMNIASATFWNQSEELTFDQMEYVVNGLMILCGVNDDYWTHVDGMRIESGVWRGRNIISDVTLFIELDEMKGFKVSFIGMNKFLNKIVSV